MIDTEQKLIEALNYINPDDYDTWLKVGMALKHEGVPFSVWDNWSRQSSKYHEGECFAKWKSFNERNSGQPVTGGTLLMMAKQNGFTPGKQTFDRVPYSIRSAKQEPENSPTQNIETLPANYKPEKIPDFPANYDPARDMQQYLRILFQSEENVCYCDRLTQQQGKDGKARFVPLQSVKDRTAGQIIKALDTGIENAGICFQSEGGAFIRFNPMDGKGDGDANVTDFRFCLIESDMDTLEKQYGLYKALNLPIAALIHSGNKSLHAITHVDAQNIDEYRERVRFIYDYCKKHGLHVDEQDKNASRYSRLPGIKRGEKWQYIIDTNIGAKSFRDWEAWAMAQYDRDHSTQTTPPMQEAEQQEPPHKLFTIPFSEFVSSANATEWLIYGFIPKKAFVMTFGESGAGKTFVIVDQVSHIAAAAIKEAKGEKPEKWHYEHVVRGGQVLYIAGEGVNGLRKRARMWALCHKIDLKELNRYFRFSSKACPLDSAEDTTRGTSQYLELRAELDMLRSQAEPFKPDLIVFDTLNRNMLGDENSSQDASAFIARAQALIDDYDCTVLLVHHSGWGIDAKKRGRGSSAWKGSTDVETMIQAMYNKADTPVKLPFIRVEQTKAKDEDLQEPLYFEKVKVEVQDDQGKTVINPYNSKPETTLILRPIQAKIATQFENSSLNAEELPAEIQREKARAEKARAEKQYAAADTPPSGENAIDIEPSQEYFDKWDYED